MRGFTCGTFDFLHAGHIHMLKQCKRMCDYLVVGLQVDPSVERKDKNKPVESLLERQIKLRACKYVDDIIVYESDTDLLIMLRHLDIGIRFLGSDYKEKQYKIKEPDAVPIEFTHWMPPTSSDIRRRIK